MADLVRERAALERHLPRGFWMMILGSDHRVFTDLSAVPAFSTTPDSPQALATAQAVVVGFVDETRHGVHSDLIRTGGAAFPLRRFP